MAWEMGAKNKAGLERGRKAMGLENASKGRCPDCGGPVNPIGSEARYFNCPKCDKGFPAAKVVDPTEPAENARPGAMQWWGTHADRKKFLKEAGKDERYADLTWNELPEDVQEALQDALSKDDRLNTGRLDKIEKGWVVETPLGTGVVTAVESDGMWVNLQSDWDPSGKGHWFKVPNVKLKNGLSRGLALTAGVTDGGCGSRLNHCGHCGEEEPAAGALKASAIPSEGIEHPQDTLPSAKEGQSPCPRSYSEEHVFMPSGEGKQQCDLCGKTRTKVEGTLGKWRENDLGGLGMVERENAACPHCQHEGSEHGETGVCGQCDCLGAARYENEQGVCRCGHSQANHQDNGQGSDTSCLQCFDAKKCGAYSERQNSYKVKALCESCLGKNPGAKVQHQMAGAGIDACDGCGAPKAQNQLYVAALENADAPEGECANCEHKKEMHDGGHCSRRGCACMEYRTGRIPHSGYANSIRAGMSRGSTRYGSPRANDAEGQWRSTWDGADLVRRAKWLRSAGYAGPTDQWCGKEWKNLPEDLKFELGKAALREPA